MGTYSGLPRSRGAPRGRYRRIRRRPARSCRQTFCIQGAGLDAMMSSVARTYQLPWPPARQDTPQPLDEPVDLHDEEERTWFADYCTAVLDFAPFTDAAKPVSAFTMYIFSNSDAFLWITKRIA